MRYQPFAVASLAATLAASIGTPAGVAQLASRPEPGPIVRTVKVVITPDVYDDLARLADSLHFETVRCLIGVERGDSLVIDLAWEPEIEESSRHHVRYRPCPLATLALWHNHIAGPGTEPREMCYLSHTDIDEAVQSDSPMLQVVQVDARVICWWTQNQVLQSRQALKLDALPGQLFGVTVRPSPSCPSPTAGPCADRAVAEAVPRPNRQGR